MAAPVILCFRRDLRLADQPALAAALEAAGEAGAGLLPVHVHETEGDWPPGAASRWWLHHSLAALDADLRARGSGLILRRGPLSTALTALQAETGARAVFAMRRAEPAARAAEAEARRALAGAGADLHLFAGDGLHAPDRLRNVQGAPYRVFTPFWKALAALPAPSGLASAPGRLPAPSVWPASLALAELDLLPRRDWAVGLQAAWTPGEAGAQTALARFLAEAAADYPVARDLPGRAGVSRLSPHLHFGEIAPARLWAAARAAPTAAGEAWRRQLAWRDFARQLLWHFPGTARDPLDARFERFPWREDAAALAAWQRGETGYPLVDAGMRELWSTGWMHGRVRMVTASFLAKHLLIDWRDGARWFWDTLVDADLANNGFGWQWTAGCGADAAPYFRVFNPTAQAQRFDAGGEYLRRWLPELAALPDRWLPQPWAAPAEALATAGIRLGRDYPQPIVEHGAARARALAAWQSIAGRTRAEGIGT